MSGKGSKLPLSGYVVRRFGLVFSAQALVFIQSILFVPMVIKVSGEATYGAYLLVLSYIGVVFALSSFGVSFDCRRWLPSAESSAERARVFLPQFWFHLCSAILLGASSAVIYVKAVSPFIDAPSPAIWLILLYLPGLTLFSQSADYFRDTHRTRVFSLAIVAQPYLLLVICLVAYAGGHALNLNLLLGSMAVASFFVGGVLFTVITREVGFTLIFPSFKEFQRAAKFGLPMVGAGIVEAIQAASDKYIIASVLDVRAVGVYAPAYTLGVLILVLPRVLAAVLLPILSREAHQYSEQSGHFLRQAIQGYLLIAIPYSVATVIFGHFVLTIYTNAKIADASYLALSLIASSTVFSGLVMLRTSVLFVRLKSAKILKFSITMMMTNIILNLILLRWTGLVWTCGLAVLGTALVGYWLTGRALKNDPMNCHISANWLLNVFLLTGLMVLAVMGLRAWWPWQPGHLAWGLQMMLGIVIYLFGLGIWVWLKRRYEK